MKQSDMDRKKIQEYIVRHSERNKSAHKKAMSDFLIKKGLGKMIFSGVKETSDEFPHYDDKRGVSYRIVPLDLDPKDLEDVIELEINKKFHLSKKNHDMIGRSYGALALSIIFCLMSLGAAVARDAFIFSLLIFVGGISFLFFICLYCIGHVLLSLENIQDTLYDVKDLFDSANDHQNLDQHSPDSDKTDG